MKNTLKGTLTEENLLKAFAGESQARNRYNFFASQAKKDGYEQIAAVFDITAEQEKEHAKRFFKYLEGGMATIHNASYPAGIISTTEHNLVEAAAGVAVLPKDTIGAVMSIDMLVGSHKIGDKHLFLGAGVGYHGFYLADEKYNFMPIEVALRMPLIEQKHAPMFGMALGYGIALSKDYVGGIYAGVDLGYRYTINTKTALVAALYAQFQQARLLTNETIEGNMFSHITGRNLVAAGLKIAIYL
jgi:hypothetical protein